MKTRFSNLLHALAIVLLTIAVPLAAQSITSRVVRSRIAGIDLVAYRTGVQNVVTFRGSLPAGDSFAPTHNLAIPTLVGDMLDKGTRLHDKFEIAGKLEGVGAKISFSVDGVMLNISGKCLRKDLSLVIGLLAEQLRAPAFSEEEFGKLKKQLAGDYRRMLENTEFRANEVFHRAVYPAGHPNYLPPVQDFLAATEAAKITDLRTFHSAHYGPAQLTLVAVGDLDIPLMQSEMEKAFGGWSGGRPRPIYAKAKSPETPKDQTVFLADKTNVSVIFGQGTGLTHADPDALALRLGNAVLGSGFTGRLMAIVRDTEGLTYHIGSRIMGDSFSDGDFRTVADFSPALLSQGLASTRRELNKWYEEGITADELERAKGDMVGSFKVGLATTEGLAVALLGAIHRGYGIQWLDEFPAKVNGVTLDQVNRAIKRYLNPSEMIVVKAGTAPK